MAEHVVHHGASAVLSPSHIEDALPQKWQGVDHRFCEKLREELDRLGGHAIGIDYQLITSTALFREERHRRELVEGIADLPIQNLWLRLSGFGATATGAGTRHTIEAIRDLHETGRPLVCDHVGGLVGLATLAFGGVAGISHGVAQRESFNTYGWKNLQKGGNNSRRVYIAELDRYLTDEQLKTIFSARGGKSRSACNDTSCCADIDDMIDNPHAHFITQRVRQIEDLSHTVEARRAEHFLLRHVDPAIRSARSGARLKIASDPLKKLLSSSRGRLIRLRDALDDLRLAASLAGGSRAISFRGGGRAIGAVFGR